MPHSEDQKRNLELRQKELQANRVKWDWRISYAPVDSSWPSMSPRQFTLKPAQNEFWVFSTLLLLQLEAVRGGPLRLIFPTHTVEITGCEPESLSADILAGKTQEVVTDLTARKAGDDSLEDACRCRVGKISVKANISYELR